MPATIPLLQEGRYSIEQEFPYVENCVLFQAYDTKDETPVTIVEVPSRLAKAATAAQREAMHASFTEQAGALAGFKHRSIVAVRSHFSEAGRNYLVTDPVEGVDLASVLADQNHPFTIAQISAWADTVLDVLNAMHNSRPVLIYRSIRPENIVLRADGSVELVAAGMICCGDHTASGVAASGLAYAPLEQIWPGLDAASQKVIISKYDEASERILKQGLDAKSDLYSLGATLYKLVTGHAPVDALERSIEVIDGNSDPLRSPATVEPAVPVEISDVIMKAMEIRREYRFDSAAIMRQVLKTALVRVKEREAEEALIQKVEQHDVSSVLQNAPAAAPEAGRPDPQPLRPAFGGGSTKNGSEKASAGIEHNGHSTAKPQPVNATETFELAELEDDVLGILSSSPHVSEPPRTAGSTGTTKPVVEPKTEKPAANVPLPPEPKEKVEPKVELTTVEKESSAAAGKAAPLAEPAPALNDNEQAASSLPDAEPHIEAAAAEPLPNPAKAKVSAEPKQASVPSAFTASADVEMFSDVKPRKSLGVPAMAAAVAVLLIAAAGGWFYLGSKPAPSAAAESPAASQPVPAAQQELPAAPSTEPATVSSADPAVPAADEPAAAETEPDQPEAGQQTQKVASAAPRAKKPAPASAKAPAAKKAVTVDDLINDN